MFDFTVLLVTATFLTGIFSLFTYMKSIPESLYAICEFSKSIFPILLLVLFIRSFIIEPYWIPSGSMIPTLVVGDFILVNKYQYGIKMPITNQILYSNNNPDYGDVIVFQYPLDKRINYRFVDIRKIIWRPIFAPPISSLCTSLKIFIAVILNVT